MLGLNSFSFLNYYCFPNNQPEFSPWPRRSCLTATCLSLFHAHLLLFWSSSSRYVQLSWEPVISLFSMLLLGIYTAAFLSLFRHSSVLSCQHPSACDHLIYWIFTFPHSTILSIIQQLKLSQLLWIQHEIWQTQWQGD